MVLWIVFAVMTGASAFALLWPLSRAKPSLENGVGDATSLYRAQVAEIERDAGRGLILPAEAEAARAEAARRLLRASENAASGPDDAAGAHRRRKIASLAVLAVVPVVALGLYARQGAPSLPGQPLSARLSTDPTRLDIDAAVARIENHLALNPGDVRGWDVIAPIYLRLGRAEDAIRAFENAVRQGGPEAERLAGLGEARMIAAGGIVTAEAKAAFEQALALDPAAPRPRYFLAVALEQDGHRTEALDALRALASGAPTEAPWLPGVRQRIASLEAPAGPGDTLAALPPAARQEAIRGMVQGLAERLETSGGSLEEWSRLIRARIVLGDAPAARAALATARERLGGQPGASEGLDTLARDLGLRTGAP
jgi:cytochrome c-type biogenesis protein CcmH